MYISLDAFVYTMTTICTFALGIGVGGYIENRRIKSFDIETLISDYMTLASYISRVQPHPPKNNTPRKEEPVDLSDTQDLRPLPGEEDDYI